MTPWTDLFLAMPLPENWQNGLLFLTFGLHLLFVLLMLGLLKPSARIWASSSSI